MKVLITGGAGFIGSHLVERLIRNKNKIIVLDNLSTGRLDNIKNFRRSIEFIKVDISKSLKLEKYFRKVDVVYHLAALADIVPSINFPLKYFLSNVQGTINVLQASYKNNVKKFVYTASSSCYGIPKTFPTSEKDEIDPKYPYALTKKTAEDFVMHWGKVYKLNVSSLRLFNVYGTRSRTSGTYGAMFGTFLRQKLSNEPFTVVGNGTQKRDFIYVSDVIDALIKTANYKKNCSIFNLGSGKPVSINEICHFLKGKKKYIPKRPGEPDQTFANINKIKKELNWRPKVKIEKGIEIMLKNINYWSKAPLWTPEKIKVATKDWFKFLK